LKGRGWEKQPRPRLGGPKKTGPFFGLELQKFLVAASHTESDLVRMLERMGRKVSKQYVNMVVRNQRSCSPEMIEDIGMALNLSIDQRVFLHRAAALDAGYKIGGMR
jgi:hypothetical protein